jgi:hypothetical protein
MEPILELLVEVKYYQKAFASLAHWRLWQQRLQYWEAVAKYPARTTKARVRQER